jgi:hypothetical protein
LCRSELADIIAIVEESDSDVDIHQSDSTNHTNINEQGLAQQDDESSSSDEEERPRRPRMIIHKRIIKIIIQFDGPEKHIYIFDSDSIIRYNPDVECDHNWCVRHGDDGCCCCTSLDQSERCIGCISVDLMDVNIQYIAYHTKINEYTTQIHIKYF